MGDEIIPHLLVKKYESFFQGFLPCIRDAGSFEIVSSHNLIVFKG